MKKVIKEAMRLIPAERAWIVASASCGVALALVWLVAVGMIVASACGGRVMKRQFGMRESVPFMERVISIDTVCARGRGCVKEVYYELRR